MTSEFFGPLPPSDFNQDAMVRWLDQQVVSFQKIITGSLQADNVLSSSNYVAGVSGWMIDGDGNAEFNDVTVRGDIVSGNWDGADPANLASYDSDATEGFYLDSSAGAAQFMGSLFVGGDIILISEGRDGQFKSAASGPRIEIVNGAGVSSQVTWKPGNTSAGEFLTFFIKATNDSAPGAVLSGTRYIYAHDNGIDIYAGDSLTGTGQNIRLRGTTRLVDGSVSTPALAFIDDTNTGIYRVGADVLGVAVGGANRVRFGDSPHLEIAFGSSGAAGLKFWETGDFGGRSYEIRRTNNFGGFQFVGITSGGTETVSFEIYDNGPVRFLDGTATAPALTFYNDTNTGIHRPGNDIFGIAVGGVEQVRFINGGAGSSFYLERRLSDVGNHETLRLDRDTGAGLAAVGYFSSWEFDRDTGERRKEDIISLVDSPRWKRDWFYKIRPVDFRRLSTGEREFGFLLDEWVQVDDNMKYLTTKGDEWGYSPHDTAILAAAVLEIQDHESRLRALEQRLAA